jgi:hypothetical protein
MHKCNFCQRDDFPSPQSFYAHCRWCDAYKQHKHNLNSASGTSLRQAMPKGRSQQARSVPIQPPASPQPSDPMAPFMKALQGAGLLPSNVGGAEETSQQKRRRLLQSSKIRMIDHYWSFTGTVTVEMRAAAKLTIDHELRNEPLEELPPQEVDELVGGIRDRVYTSLSRQQEKDARRTQEAEERKRANQRDDDRKHTERKKRKAAFLNESQRRVITFLKTHTLSPRQRLQVMEETLTLLDEALTGDEPLPEAYAAIDAVLQARVADWDAYEAAREARQHEEWMEIGAVILVLIALGVMYVKAPEILNWLLKILWPEPAANSGGTGKPTEEAPCPPPDGQTPPRPSRRMRRPPQSAAPEPPSSPSNPESANPFL